jgi:hypothetical protein
MALQVTLPVHLRQVPPSSPQSCFVLPAKHRWSVLSQHAGHCEQVQVPPLQISPTLHCAAPPHVQLPALLQPSAR